MKKFTFTLLLLFWFTLANAQYTFEQDNQTYTDLVSPISLNNGMTWVNPDYVINIGFDFTLFSNTINSFYTSSDFISTIILNSDYQVLSAIVPYGAFLCDRNINYNTWVPSAGSISPISYKTEGEIGNRIFKLEWKNAGFEEEILDYEDASTDFVNIQLWCYEGSNVIEFHYGPNNIEHPNSSFFNGSGPLIGLFPSITEDGPDQNGLILQGDASNPTMISTQEDIFLNGSPQNGKVFRFIPATSNIDDSFVEKIKIFPNPVVDSFEIQNLDSINEGYIYDNVGKLIKKFDS